MNTTASKTGKCSRDSTIGEATSSVTLAAVAFQDHLVRSLALGNPLRPKAIGLGPAARAKQKKEVKTVINTGRSRRTDTFGRKTEENKVGEEYVLDPKPPPLTLAQKMGLVEAPAQLLSEQQWGEAKQRSNCREDSMLPCVICKEDFGVQPQVLLSCTHVFHRACLQAFERFTGRKTCPMCRREEYQTRIIHEGAKQHRIKCATIIQAYWRGYVVRCWYRKIRETRPPTDPRLRQKFFEEKLKVITDRIVRSCDFHVNDFLWEVDQNLAASRNVFRQFDAAFKCISDDDWDDIQLKAVERAHQDCPICLTSLVSHGYGVNEGTNSILAETKLPAATKHQGRQSRTPKSKTSHTKLGQSAEFPCDRTHPESSKPRQTVLLSCSHVFHETCLNMLEQLAIGEIKKICPVCRTPYQKKVLPL